MGRMIYRGAYIYLQYVPQSGAVLAVGSVAELLDRPALPELAAYLGTRRARA